MKTYQIMFEDDPPTDMEINQYQNFEQLLQQHKAIVKRRKLLQSLALGAGLLVVTFMLIGILSSDHHEKKQEVSPEPVQEQETMVTDSAASGQTAEKKDTLHLKEPVTSPEQSQESKPTKPASNPEKETSLPLAAEKEAVFMEARPVGGFTALYDYFEEKLQYPETAKTDGVEGAVLLEFEIDQEGAARQVSVLQGVREDIDQEAIRLIRQMPQWQPAQLNGEPMTSKQTLSLTFQLDQ